MSWYNPAEPGADPYYVGHPTGRDSSRITYPDSLRETARPLWRLASSRVDAARAEHPGPMIGVRVSDGGGVEICRQWHGSRPADVELVESEADIEQAISRLLDL